MEHSIPVSIRAPARGATVDRGHEPATPGDRFNPRPRTGGDSGTQLEVRRHRVSIRAPARGATARVVPRAYAGISFSIRAPARGATKLSSTSHWSSSGTGFNPRPRTGGDSRSWRPRRTQAIFSFNPRPRTGGDRRPSGVRVRGHEVPGFNPRPRTGGDWPLALIRLVIPSVSIRAPARGATSCESSRFGTGSRSKFQSAPPHGGRPAPPPLLAGAPPYGQRASSSRRCFNPRPRTGGDG